MDELIQLWQQEEAQRFTGWDFSHLDGRMHEGQPPWSYTTRARELMRQAASVLDLGTAGGERLLMMQPDWPAKVVVTEEYPPNVKLARARLAPLGVTVVEVALREHEPMPFANAEFELVLNRHTGFDVDESARILTPGGTLLTQQVHGMWAHDLLACFGATPQWPHVSLGHYVPWLKRAGLEIVMQEDWSGELAFTDVGAIVYYLKAVPWLVPGFTVKRYREDLLTLQRKLEQDGRLVFTAKKIMVEAKKPE